MIQNTSFFKNLRSISESKYIFSIVNKRIYILAAVLFAFAILAYSFYAAIFHTIDEKFEGSYHFSYSKNIHRKDIINEGQNAFLREINFDVLLPIHIQINHDLEQNTWNGKINYYAKTIRQNIMNSTVRDSNYTFSLSNIIYNEDSLLFQFQDQNRVQHKGFILVNQKKIIGLDTSFIPLTHLHYLNPYYQKSQNEYRIYIHSEKILETDFYKKELELYIHKEKQTELIKNSEEEILDIINYIHYGKIE